MKNVETIVGIILIILLLVLLLGGAGMMSGMMGSGMMGGYGAYGFGFNPLGTILSIVFWALIIAGVVFLGIWLARNLGQASPRSGETPFDILKMRYAKGEITKEQFDTMKQDLG